MVVQLDHIVLSGSDVERIAKFYYKMLGFKYEPVGLARIRPSLVIQFIQRPAWPAQDQRYSVWR